MHLSILSIFGSFDDPKKKKKIQRERELNFHSISHLSQKNQKMTPNRVVARISLTRSFLVRYAKVCSFL